MSTAPSPLGLATLLDRSLACTRQVLLPSLPWAALVALPLVLSGRAALFAAPPGVILASPWRALAVAVGWGVALGAAQALATGALAAGVQPAVVAWAGGGRLGAGEVVQAGLRGLARGLLGAALPLLAWLALVAPAVGALAAVVVRSDGAAEWVAVVVLALVALLWGTAAAALVVGKLALALPAALATSARAPAILRAAADGAKGNLRTTLGLAALLFGAWLGLAALAALAAPAPDVVSLSTAALEAVWPALVSAQALGQALAQGLALLVAVPGVAAITLLWQARPGAGERPRSAQ